MKLTSVRIVARTPEELIALGEYDLDLVYHAHGSWHLIVSRSRVF